MGCGLRKLEDPDDSSPGKIFSTLKRPQVETKTDCAYEYMLLDFSLEGMSASRNFKCFRGGKAVLLIVSLRNKYGGNQL